MTTCLRHRLHPRLLSKQASVLVIGAGGTGSHVASLLAVLHQSMLDLGHPFGLQVCIMDDDTVSRANVGRSAFYEADVGLNKALVVANRVNLCFGTAFYAEPRRAGEGAIGNADIVISCVDTPASRREIWKALTGWRAGQAYARSYWLDLGNDEADGQCILGEWGGAGGAKDEGSCPRLPCVVELYPQLLDARLDPKEPGPSCSRAEALNRQGAFVNRQAALHGVAMLATLFRQGFLDHHGVLFDTRTGRSTPLACDVAAWRRMGYDPEAPPPQVKKAGRAKATAVA